MPRGLAGAWLVGIGLLTWRGVTQYHKPVPAGRYAVASGLFALLALLANYQPAAGAATVAAWGFDVALLLKPGTLPGTSSGGETGSGSSSGQPGPPGGGFGGIGQTAQQVAGVVSQGG